MNNLEYVLLNEIYIDDITKCRIIACVEKDIPKSEIIKYLDYPYIPHRTRRIDVVWYFENSNSYIIYGLGVPCIHYWPYIREFIRLGYIYSSEFICENDFGYSSLVNEFNLKEVD